MIKKEAPEKLTVEEKIEAILDLLALNGMSLPEKLRPTKGK